ncbi:hypothetical protein [Flavivirga sp. 57AJ16]|uniref:hypothetical protein n=1 Tax=Flavivirga sp. 57AJ16 TaxID=3025307 RepID=UPI002367084C|nr:hypothetical protein [Flavivirga sp. 57AJ16]MDD7886107.1 hypothetical protein [Flavivirga sp. 57AJ16]
MKTKKILSLMLISILGIQSFKAQSINQKIEKSVVEIGETFTSIPNDRLMVLDQIAFKLFKQYDGINTVDVIIVDENNSEASQLAMIWLNTGLLYYGHQQMSNIQSAGTKNNPNTILNLNDLKQFGFKVINNSSKSLKIKYGSGSWSIYPKSLQSLNPKSDAIEIVIVEGVMKHKNTIVITFSNTESIAREMLYLATRINNLFGTKNK